MCQPFEGIRFLNPTFEDDQTEEIARSTQQMVLDIGGMQFRYWNGVVRTEFNSRSFFQRVMKKNFAVLPTTRLSRLVRAETDAEILSICDSYAPGETPEYYFNRNACTFNSILDFYRLGTLHLKVDSCAMVFKASAA